VNGPCHYTKGEELADDAEEMLLAGDPMTARPSWQRSPWCNPRSRTPQRWRSAAAAARNGSR
jgi:hypothetical protein